MNKVLDLFGIHGMNNGMRGDSAKKFEKKLRIIMAERGWGRPKLKEFVKGKISPHTIDTLLNHKRMGEDMRNTLACSLPDMGFTSSSDLINYQVGSYKLTSGADSYEIRIPQTKEEKDEMRRLIQQLRDDIMKEVGALTVEIRAVASRVDHLENPQLGLPEKTTNDHR